MKESIRNHTHVKEQYADDTNLTARISIHDKYSVNRTGFGNWLFEQYDFFTGCRILELGCGTGSLWKGRKLPGNTALTLTDFSAGMLDSARTNLAGMGNVTFLQADIQNIPFEDGAFDYVIANMMLYHVPDIDRAIAEVRRVLKPGGTFACATSGENGIAEFVWSIFAISHQLPPVTVPFTLQNGGAMLEKHFDTVQIRRYEDHLEVTDPRDLVSYIRSLKTMADFSSVTDEEMLAAFGERMENGVLTVPKEYGTFLAD